jgi:hypothetical protein
MGATLGAVVGDVCTGVGEGVTTFTAIEPGTEIETGTVILIALAYKLIEAAQSRWRAVNAPHLVALVRAGAKFENGKLVERPDDTAATEEAA